MIAQYTVDDAGQLRIANWSSLRDGSVGAWYDTAGSKCSLQIEGKFAGGTCFLEGTNSLDGTAQLLHDHEHLAAQVTKAGIISIAQLVRFVRPRVEGGPDTSLRAIIVCQKG